MGNLALSHSDYIDLLGKHGQNTYPNFSENPNDAFHCLRFDLENFLKDFTENNAEIFRQKAPERIEEIVEIQSQNYSNEKKIYSGDQRTLDEINIEFKNGNYKQVSKLEMQIKHRDLLTLAELKLLEINERKLKKQNWFKRLFAK